MTNHEVGQYLNRHFVSAYQKVATFRIRAGAKEGGNVASYFCTPDGRVLHAVAGPVEADEFLREARWANETYQLGMLGKAGHAELQAFFRKAHYDRLKTERRVSLPIDKLPPPDTVTPKLLDDLLLENAYLRLSESGQVHLLLSVAPMPRLDQIYQVVFERILNEKISTDPVRVGEKR